MDVMNNGFGVGWCSCDTKMRRRRREQKGDLLYLMFDLPGVFRHRSIKDGDNMRKREQMLHVHEFEMSESYWIDCRCSFVAFLM